MSKNLKEDCLVNDGYYYKFVDTKILPKGVFFSNQKCGCHGEYIHGNVQNFVKVLNRGPLKVCVHNKVENAYKVLLGDEKLFDDFSLKTKNKTDENILFKEIKKVI